MHYGVDLTYPPSPQWAQQVAALGWDWLAVYVGGPRATARDSWQQRDGQRYPVAVINPHISRFLPIYVGRQFPWDGPGAFGPQSGRLDGEDANKLTGACGFDSTTPLCLDLEYGNYQRYGDRVIEYVQGWVERVNAAGHPAWLYSDIETLSKIQLGTMIDAKWGAAWVRGAATSTPPAGQFDPAQPPPWQAWQYANGQLVGVNVDFDSITDEHFEKLATYG